jgi:integrase/recombinase XerD
MSPDVTRILTRSEIADVLADLHRKRRSRGTRQNQIVFRLATCCGLRVSEIVGLSMNNMKLDGKRPHIHVPAAIAKRRKARKVPLWWDAANLAALDAWKRERKSEGAEGDDSFADVPSVRACQYRFKTAIKALGKERQSTLSIHCGRHSFCSHALAGGRQGAEVRDAAGHANISTTSIYAHVVTDDDEELGNLFTFAK